MKRLKELTLQTLDNWFIKADYIIKIRIFEDNGEIKKDVKLHKEGDWLVFYRCKGLYEEYKPIISFHRNLTLVIIWLYHQEKPEEYYVRLNIEYLSPEESYKFSVNYSTREEYEEDETEYKEELKEIEKIKEFIRSIHNLLKYQASKTVNI